MLACNMGDSTRNTRRLVILLVTGNVVGVILVAVSGIPIVKAVNGKMWINSSFSLFKRFTRFDTRS